MGNAGNEMLMKAEYKYFAFISYSRKDSRAASFFHRKIEHFRIPTKYVAPERLPQNRKFAKPVFRDRRDLEARQDSFSEDIKWALEASRYLLVICSPNSAGSEWVEAEISHFLKTHGNDLSLVVPVILSGEPGSGSPDSECLPPSLRDKAILVRNLPSMIPDAGEQEKDGWENGVIQSLSYLLQVSRERIRASVDAERVRQTRIYAAIGAVCAIVFGMLSFWAVRAEKRALANERRAVDRERLASRTLDFMRDTLQVAQPDESGPRSVVDIFAERQFEIENLEPPELKKSVSLIVGGIFLGQSMVEPAERLVSSACEYLEKHPDDEDYWMAKTLWGMVQMLRGDFEAATATFRKVDANMPQNGMPGFRRELLLSNVGTMLALRGETAAAEAMLTNAWSSAKGKPGLYRGNVAIGLVGFLTAQGRLADAESLLDEVAADFSGPVSRDTVLFLMSRGRVNAAAGRFAESKADFESALKVVEKLYGRNSFMTISALDGLAFAERGLNDGRLALKHLEEAVSIGEQTFPNGNVIMCKIYNNLGNVAASQMEFDKGARYLKRAIEEYERFFPGDSQWLAVPYVNYAEAMVALGKRDEAQVYVRRADEIAENAMPEGCPDRAACQSALKELKRILKESTGREEDGQVRLADELHERVVSLMDGRKYADALSLCDQMLEIRDRPGCDPRSRKLSEMGLKGLCLSKVGRTDEGLKLLMEVLDQSIARFGRESADAMILYGNIASVCRDAGDFARAVEFFRKSLNVALVLKKPGSEDVLSNCWALTDALRRAGDLVEAERVARRMLEEARRGRSDDSKEVRFAKKLLDGLRADLQKER